MRIFLSGACNARDIGGIATANGTTKLQRLVRCGELSRITPQDVSVLQALPLQRVVDLRTAEEMQRSPDVKIEGVQYLHNPIIRSTTFGITYEKSSGSEIAQMLQAGLERMRQRGETYFQHMELLYRRFVSDEYSRKGYGSFLRLLAQHPTNGVTLWHCTAGKDRVGTCTALLLHCLGASKEQIFEDYLLTNVQSADSTNSIVNKVKGFVSDDNVRLIEKMLSADAAFLQGFFDEIDHLFGSIENFLSDCGVTENDITLLRENYLD